MYDILFICKHCGVHLSADENDVGAVLPCPECAQEIKIPVGDILFQCPACSKSLLAGRTAARQHFHCPCCKREMIVPPIGKTIPVAEKTELIPPPPVLRPLAAPPEKPAPPPSAPEAAGSKDDRQFMSTSGDYLAEAGMTKDANASPLDPPRP